MPMSDPQEILLAHDQWATRQILDSCAKLSPEKFHQRFEMGPGSLHDTTTHIVGAMLIWTQILAGQEPGPRIEQDGRRRSPAELLSLLDSTAREYVAEIRRLPLSDTVTRVRNGKKYILTRSVVLTHVATHSMHHRAQCLNMLRHLGVQPSPPSSVFEWSWMAGL